MSKKLAFDTLITALACLLETDLDYSSGPIQLNSHRAFYMDNKNMFCDARRHLNETWKIFEEQNEQNQRRLLRLQLETLQLFENNGNKSENIEVIPIDCQNLSDGVHKFKSKGISTPFYTVCDDENMLVLQQYGENKPQYHTFAQAQKGFGVLYDDFFIGLNRVYALVKDEKYEALVILKTPDYETIFAFYTEFEIFSHQLFYEIKNLGGCRGDGCDILGKPKKRPFIKKNCKTRNKVHWWDFSCHDSMFVKVYLKAKVS